MSIYSSLDSQSLLLTRKLLEKHCSSLSQALPEPSSSRYPLDEMTIELDLETINHIINELTTIGKSWLDEDNNDNYHERKQIMAYLLKQWIKVGEEATRLNQSNMHIIH